MKALLSRIARKIKSTPSHSNTHMSLLLSRQRAPTAEEPAEANPKIFRFLDLPPELRNKIYKVYFDGWPSTFERDRENYNLTSANICLFLVSKQIHEEASHFFYSSHTIQLFPYYPHHYFRRKRPSLVRLAPRYRASVTSFQIHFDPNLTNASRGWRVHGAVGLRDATSVRFLSVFVEDDTMDLEFSYGRKDGLYERLSDEQLEKVLVSVPSIIEVQFNAYPWVRQDSDIMIGLLEIASKHKKLISWGPERGWNENT